MLQLPPQPKKPTMPYQNTTSVEAVEIELEDIYKLGKYYMDGEFGG